MAAAWRSTLATAIAVAFGTACLAACGSRGAAQGSATDAATSASAVLPPPACPRLEPQDVSANGWPAAKESLAPRGAAVVRLCRYAGKRSHPRYRLLAASLVSGRATVGKLVSQFDGLGDPPPGAHCGPDDGSEILARLVYPSRHQVTISAGLTGCQLVTNGNFGKSAYTLPSTGPALLAELKRLLGRSTRPLR